MRTLLLLIAAVIAVVAGIAALQWSNNNMGPAPEAPVVNNAPAPDVTAVDVLVARRDIPIGTIIRADMIDKQPWPNHLLLEGFITGDIKNANIVGKIARTPVRAREPITANKLANADQPGFLAANLAKGNRAMTLATDAVTGIAGYVFPGDRVDVLFVHNLSGQSATPAVSEVIAPNVRVLAINIRDESITGSAASIITGSGGAPSTITIEVSDEMAQKLRLAEKVGSLSLTLRSMKDANNKEIAVPSHIDNLSQDYMSGGSGESVRIIRGVGEKDAAVPAVPASGGGLPGIFGSILGGR